VPGIFCSFFDLSGKPSRISPTKSMHPGTECRPLILLDPPISRSAANAFLDLFTKQGLEPHIASRSTHPDVIRPMVANGYRRPAGLPLSIRRQRSSQSRKFRHPLAR
jgi:hypothetical protein